MIDDSLVPIVSLPKALAPSYGCNNCEWKLINKCPHGYNGATNTGRHRGGICPERTAYLKSFYRGVNDKPSFVEWEADYLQGKGINLYHEIEIRIKFLSKKLEEATKKLESERDEDVIKVLRKESKYLNGILEREKSRLEGQWRALRNLQETRLNRETARKVDMTVTKVTPSDLHDLLRKANADVLDVEAERK